MPPFLQRKHMTQAIQERTEEEKTKLAQEMVDYLNELLELDRDAITQLMDTYVETGCALAEHPTLQVVEMMSASPLYGVGPLGVINGFIGERDKVGYVTAVYDDNFKLERFEVTTEENRAKMKPVRVNLNERKQQETGTDDDDASR